jgi:hypothetical protein
MELTFPELLDLEKRDGFIKTEPKGKRTTKNTLFFFTTLSLIMIAGTAPLNLYHKLLLVAFFTALTAVLARRYYERDELWQWMEETYLFMKQILPILLIGVFLSGVIKPLIPQVLVADLAGRNTLIANTAATLFGTVAYFPTLVEVPVAKMFMDLGMHEGPLMSYLLVDPGVSLQTLLVVNTIIKSKKTIMYALYMLAIGIAMGYLYGLLM